MKSFHSRCVHSYAKAFRATALSLLVPGGMFTSGHDALAQVADVPVAQQEIPAESLDQAEELVEQKVEPTKVAADASQLDDREIRKQVVKIYSSRRSLNLSNPWKRGDIKEVTGSGVWLGDGKILTNAHVVVYTSQLYVQPFDSSDRIAAEVVVVSPEMDLAILQLEDASAFNGLEPLKLLESLPKLRSAVQAYGYPTGGSAISVTEGVVSRIEYTPYRHGELGLRIQVDAGINPGNSGGPAIVDNRIAGLVSSRLRTGDNIGYLIPAEEIEAFFQDVQDGKFDGKPQPRDVYQRLQNDALRARFKLDNDQTGLVIVKPFGDGDDYPLKADDVITHVGPHDIDNEGMVRLDNGLRFSFSYFVPKLVKDGKFPATIVRNGETMKVQVPAGPQPEKVIKPLKGAYPEYFVYGPIVFIEGTSDYMDGIRSLMSSPNSSRHAAAYSLVASLISRKSPLVTRSADEPEFEGEQLVMVAIPLLPHRISKGYQGPSLSVLAKINGIAIKNMKHMVQVLRDSKEEQLKIEFAEKDSTYLVFNRKQIEEAMEDILIDNAIARQGSKELLREWSQRGD